MITKTDGYQEKENRKKYSARPSLKLAHCFSDWALVPSG